MCKQCFIIVNKFNVGRHTTPSETVTTPKAVTTSAVKSLYFLNFPFYAQIDDTFSHDKSTFFHRKVITIYWMNIMVYSESYSNDNTNNNKITFAHKIKITSRLF